MKQNLIIAIAITLLMAIVSLQGATDSYSSAPKPVDTYNLPSITPPDKYQKPKSKCLLHKYIKKCLKFKLVGQKQVCDQYAIVGAGKCLKHKKYSNCIKNSKPIKKCVLHSYKIN